MAKLFSEKAQLVLTYMQAHTEDQVATDIAAGAGIEAKSITGVLNGLQKRGLVERVEVEGFEKKVVRLTAAGMDADPDAEKPVAVKDAE